MFQLHKSCHSLFASVLPSNAHKEYTHLIMGSLLKPFTPPHSLSEDAIKRKDTL